MTKTDLFLAFGNIRDDYLVAAAKSMKTKQLPVIPTRSRLRYALIAASLALLIALIPITVMIANRTAPPPDLPIIDGYPSITHIPGAIVHTGDNYQIVSDYREFPLSVEAYIDHLKQIPSAVGTAKHIATVSIPYTQDLQIFKIERLLTISVFDLTVTTPVNQLEKGQTIRILTGCLYSPNGDAAMYHGFESQAISAIEQPKGYYVLNEFHGKLPHEIPQFINVDGVQYDLSQFADYYFANYYQTDGESFYYFRDIYFSEIQE